ncbi:hypothetical protein GGR52DRAFT_568483 [Hypoxylon sp. FL1284]|nr:hypothetical protein GGR52DRAFT_568483 [Hypoxylon sp. FL1284]
MPSLIEKIQAKIELFRLEQRYTRNRHRRSGFVSNAIYVDGEYIYQTPNTTGSSTDSHSSGSSSSPPSPIEEEAAAGSRPYGVADQQQATPAKKRLNRLSSMPGFGSSAKSSARDWSSNDVER